MTEPFDPVAAIEAQRRMERPRRSIRDVQPGVTLSIVTAPCPKPYCCDGVRATREVASVEDIGHDHARRVHFTDGGSAMISLHDRFVETPAGVISVSRTEASNFGS